MYLYVSVVDVHVTIEDTLFSFCAVFVVTKLYSLQYIFAKLYPEKGIKFFK